MLGLVLEGGGAKGAFHAGVIKALFENGYQFDGVCGTSIGALNGAMVAQGDFQKCLEIWENIKPSSLFDVDDEQITAFAEKQINKDNIFYMLKLFKDTIKAGGFPVDRILSIIDEHLDEDKLRNSPIDFGVVTVSLTEKFKPLELFKEDIPYGMMRDFILASAYYPAFKINPINDIKYIDGGVYDNMPINPLIRRGYDHIIAVRTMSMMPHQKVIDKTVKVEYIIPSESLGGTLNMSRKRVDFNMKLGYFDGMKFIKNYAGQKFYIHRMTDDEFVNYLSKNYKVFMRRLRTLLKISDDAPDDIVIQNLGERIRKYFKLPMNISLFDVIIVMLEKQSKDYNIEKFYVYQFNEFISEILKNLKPKEGFVRRIKNVLFDTLFYDVCNAFIVEAEEGKSKSQIQIEVNTDVDISMNCESTKGDVLISDNNIEDKGFQHSDEKSKDNS